MAVRWPARLHIKNKIIIDCCHNPHGANVLVAELQRMKIPQVTLLIGILKDKDYKAMVKILSKITKTAIVTIPITERALNPAIIKQEFEKYRIPATIIKNPKNAYHYIQKLPGYTLITGSMYLVGEILKYEKG